MTMKTKEIERNLLRKGFIKQNNDHKYFVFIHDGNDTGIKTKISHSHSEIGEHLISQMSKQLHMTKDFFKGFVECTKSEADYVRMLEYMGFIEED